MSAIHLHADPAPARYNAEAGERNWNGAPLSSLSHEELERDDQFDRLAGDILWRLGKRLRAFGQGHGLIIQRPETRRSFKPQRQHSAVAVHHERDIPAWLDQVGL